MTDDQTADEANTPEVNPEAISKEKKSSGVLKGCLIAFAVMMLLLTVGGYFVYAKVKHIFENPEVALARTGMEMALESQGFSEKDASYIVAPVMQLEPSVREGKIKSADVEKVLDTVLNKGNAKLALLHVLQEQVLKKSPYSKSQLNNVDKQISRTVEAIKQKHIDVASLKKLAEFVFEKNGEGNYTLRQSLTVKELDELLLMLTSYADSAGVADKTFDFSIKELFRKEMERIVEQLKKASPSE